MTEIAHAAELDANGDHSAAIAMLVKSVNKGSVAATLHLAARYLFADRAPYSPVDALQLFERACALGSPEAPALQSILLALGYQCPQDWRRALDKMMLAAQRGFLLAQEQLLLLSGNRKIVSRRSDSAGYWSEVANSINLQAWLAAPPDRDLSVDPVVRLFPGFASKEVCQWLIKRSRPRLQRAQVYDAVHQQITTNRTRTNSSVSFALFDTDLVNILVQWRMANCLHMPVGNFETATVLHYAPGEEITEHFDFIDPNAPNYREQIATRGQRVVTFLVYLNDNYAGGETEFPRLDLRHKAVRGDGLFFVNVSADGSPNLRTIHAGRPPVDKEKWIMSQFVRQNQVF